MIKKFSFSLILILHLCNGIYTQVSQEWIKRVSGTRREGDYAKKILKDLQGKIIVMGIVDDSTSYNNMVLYRYNADGSVIWNRKYVGPGNSDDNAEDICLDRNNNYLIAGNNRDNYQTTLIKYSQEGNLLWSKMFPYSIGYAVVSDNNNNVYIAGYIDSSGNNPNFLLTKFDENGNLIWFRTYNGPGNNIDIATFIGIDINNNVYIAGNSYYGSNYTSSDYAILKYDPFGNMIWIRRYDGPGHGLDEMYTMVVDSEGNVYAGGNVLSENFNSDFCVIKLNPSGNIIWNKLFNGTANKYDGARDLTIDNLGNIYATGFTTVSQIDFDFDYLTIKLDPNGNILWNKQFNGIGNSTDMATNLDIDINKNVYVIGTTYIPGTNDNDLATIKYDQNGNLEWNQIYHNPTGRSENQSTGVLADFNNSIYVIGATIFNPTLNGLDYTVIKYSINVNITVLSNEIPLNFTISQNYPNPFNPNTNIRFSLPKSALTKIIVYDILGKEIETLVNHQLNAGIYETNFNESNLSSGIYFYRLITEDFTETKKMLLIK